MTQGMGRVIVLVLLMGFVGLAQGRERHALLIGVSQVPAARQSVVLEGTRQDVALMRELAQWWGVASPRLQTLAESPEENARPRYANFQREMAALLERVQPGDEVLLYLSGHGTQQPVLAQDADEPDNLDEVFLFEDSTAWMPETRSIGNALSDNEMARWLAQFNAKRVLVWLVVDSCHAGTFSRGAANRIDAAGFTVVAQKALSPASLGIPWALSVPRGQASPRGLPKQGVVAFYAVAPQGIALEVRPKQGLQARVGLFTWQLWQAARNQDSRTLSFAALFAEIQKAYQTMAPAIPRPMAELWPGLRERPLSDAGRALAAKP